MRECSWRQVDVATKLLDGADDQEVLDQHHAQPYTSAVFKSYDECLPLSPAQLFAEKRKPFDKKRMTGLQQDLSFSEKTSLLGGELKAAH